MKWTPTALSSLLAVLWLSIGPLAADETPSRVTVSQQDVEEALGTKWCGYYMLGKKVGFARFSLDRSPDRGDPAYIFGLWIEITILSSSGTITERDVEETFEFDPQPPFALRGGTHTEKRRGSIVKTELVRTLQGFEAVQTADGATTRKPIGPLDDSLTVRLKPRVWLHSGAKVGDRLTIRTFSFDRLKLEPETYQFRSTKTSLVEGVNATHYEVELTSPGLGDDAMLNWYDDKGRFVSGKIGADLEVRCEPEQLAKNVEPVILLPVKTVAIDKPLGEPAKVSGLVIKVVGEEGAVFQSGPRQTVVAEGPDRFVLEMGSAHAEPVQAEPAEQEACLAESDVYPINHPRVQALMRVAISDASTPREKVDKLVHFVSKYVSPDEQNRPDRLLELLDARRGACTEYALLFTTLARAAGIPARQVSGLAYQGDGTQTFVGHAWNEVVLDGQWVPVDPAWNETDSDATHVRLFTKKPDGTGELSELRTWRSILGNVSFKLIKLERDNGWFSWDHSTRYLLLLVVAAVIVLVGWQRVRNAKRH
jgi:hypothetical protein